MKNSLTELHRFREFLQSIPLTRYREETKDIKWVEQDLPKELLPLASIFKYYWEERNFLRLNQNDWFKKGFKARMYRTWVSVLTQLDFCYMFLYVCAWKGKSLPLVYSAELDEKGIDAQVGDIGFQVSKISERKEARAGKSRRKIIQIPYAVFNLDELKRRLNSKRTRNNKENS